MKDTTTLSERDIAQAIREWGEMVKGRRVKKVTVTAGFSKGDPPFLPDTAAVGAEIEWEDG